jgi:hypothetical protein
MFPVSKYFRLIEFGQVNNIEMLKDPETAMKLAFQISKNVYGVAWFFNAIKSNSIIFNIVLELKDDEIVIKFHCRDGNFRTLSALIADYSVEELIKFHEDEPIVTQYWNYQGEDMDLLSPSETEGKKMHSVLMIRLNMVYSNYNSYNIQKTASSNELKLLNRCTRNGKYINKELLYAVDPMDPLMGNGNDNNNSSEEA